MALFVPLTRGMAGPVLVVDDDPGVVEALRAELASREVQIQTATDARAACALLDQQRFCGLVLDVVLADGSGFDVLHHLRRTGIPLPTVVVTQKLPSYIREMLDHEQVKLLLPKPIDARVLAAVILGLCGLES